MNSRRARLRRRWRIVVLVVLVSAAMAAGAIYTNAFGAGDRFEHVLARIELAIDPPPDRPTVPTVQVTTRPTRVPEPAGPSGSSAPGVTVTPAPTPVRRSVDVRLAADPKTMFISQVTKDWCAPAGTQITLAILGLAENSPDFQRRLERRTGEWESRRDSRNGGWGPGVIVQALAAYGAPGYQIRAHERRQDALRDAAIALTVTKKPVVLIAWRGAHTWVMTGYRADADQTVYPDATITGTYIFDPWYPRVSSIWGPSDPPGTFQDAAEMRRNYLPWQRPEGHYPDRDGLYLIIIPPMPSAYASINQAALRPRALGAPGSALVAGP